MAEELFIPKLGQTVEEVTIIEWLVEDGSKVDAGMPVLDVETDKAVFPIEATVSGYLHKGPYKAGDVVPVLTVVGIIGKKEDSFLINPSERVTSSISEQSMAGEEQIQAARPPTASVTELTTTSHRFISPRAKKLAQAKNVDLSGVKPTGYVGVRIVERDVLQYLSNLPKATPVALNVASQAGIDISQVQGTGIRGMITKADIHQAVKEKSLTIDQTSKTDKETGKEPITGDLILNRIPIKGVKGIIFDRMGTSVHTTARVTLFMEVNATELVQIREKLKTKVAESWGFSPGYNDLLGIIVARTLKEFPYMNARVNQDNTEIEWLAQVNIGLAVDTDKGLIVPVIKNADQKGLREFGEEFRALVDRARSGRSLLDDIQGGTFTITNLGMYDIDAFTPVINLPEAAILGVGRITSKYVPVNNQPVIQQIINLSLVFDHRLVDGAPAARFLQRIKDYIENPYLLLS
jgi:pyruvate dehydrogenase E2 component (dihydrolipoamide acetyltransferase)